MAYREYWKFPFPVRSLGELELLTDVESPLAGVADVAESLKGL